jgi:predicted Zn-dependent protease
MPTKRLPEPPFNEVSHTIHHDTMTLMQKRKEIPERGAGTAILLGPTQAHVLAIALLGQPHSLSYSRDVESLADLTGSDICAAAGHNPGGLVWLFRDFDNADVAQVPQLLSGSSQQSESDGCPRAAFP